MGTGIPEAVDFEYRYTGYFQKLKKSGTGMPGNSRHKIVGNQVAKSRELSRSGGNYSSSGIPGHVTS